MVPFSNVTVTHNLDKNHFSGQVGVKTYSELDLRENERVCSHWVHNVIMHKGN